MGRGASRSRAGGGAGLGGRQYGQAWEMHAARAGQQRGAAEQDPGDSDGPSCSYALGHKIRTREPVQLAVCMYAPALEALQARMPQHVTDSTTGTHQVLLGTPKHRSGLEYASLGSRQDQRSAAGRARGSPLLDRHGCLQSSLTSDRGPAAPLLAAAASSTRTNSHKIGQAIAHSVTEAAARPLERGPVRATAVADAGAGER